MVHLIRVSCLRGLSLLRACEFENTKTLTVYSRTMNKYNINKYINIPAIGLNEAHKAWQLQRGVLQKHNSSECVAKNMLGQLDGLR
jgi:hypothetical protein